MPATPSLDLDAIVPDRETVLIRTAAYPDGKLFEFRGEMELGILARQEILTLYTKVGEAWSDEEGLLDRATAELVATWIEEMLSKILHTPLDDEMRAELTDTKKFRIVTYFLEEVLPKVVRQELGNETVELAPKKTKKATTSTGAS